MKNRNRSYFLINANGEMKDILWIEERRPGQLLIVQTEPANLGWESGDAIGDAHFSIHAPDHGSVTTITRKMDRILPSSDREQLSTVMHIPFSEDGFAVVLQGVARSNLMSDRFNSKSRREDQIMNLGYHDPNQSTSVYSIIVSRHPRSLRMLRNQRLRLKSCKTATYQVGVYYGFQYIPSNAFQAPTIMMSKPPKIGGKIIGEGGIHIDPSDWTDIRIRNAAIFAMKNSMLTNYLQISKNLPEYQNTSVSHKDKIFRIHRACASLM